MPLDTCRTPGHPWHSPGYLQGTCSPLTLVKIWKQRRSQMSNQDFPRLCALREDGSGILWFTSCDYVWDRSIYAFSIQHYNDSLILASKIVFRIYKVHIYECARYDYTYLNTKISTKDMYWNIMTVRVSSPCMGLGKLVDSFPTNGSTGCGAFQTGYLEG